jgi:hypothetical protein
MLQAGVIKKAKKEYWGVLHFGNPLYHVWAERAGTYRQAMKAAKSELQKRAAQQNTQAGAGAQGRRGDG